MKILGTHDENDAAGSLLVDGFVVHAIQEEKICKEKNYTLVSNFRNDKYLNKELKLNNLPNIKNYCRKNTSILISKKTN